MNGKFRGEMSNMSVCKTISKVISAFYRHFCFSRLLDAPGTLTNILISEQNELHAKMELNLDFNFEDIFWMLLTTKMLKAFAICVCMQTKETEKNLQLFVILLFVLFVASCRQKDLFLKDYDYDHELISNTWKIYNTLKRIKKWKLTGFFNWLSGQDFLFNQRFLLYKHMFVELFLQTYVQNV